MKVLFVTDVPGTAKAGQIKEVKDGYARNYLIPNRMAVQATESEIKRREQSLKAEERKLRRAEDDARSLANRLAEAAITVRARAGTEDRLYGSVTNGDIADALKAQFGYEVDKRRVELGEPIRHLGTYEVPIHLTRDVVPKVKVTVVAE